MGSVVTKGLEKLRAWQAADPVNHTQSALARAIRRSQPTVCDWFAAVSRPDSSSRARLKRFLGIEIDDWEPEEEREIVEQVPPEQVPPPSSSRLPKVRGPIKGRRARGPSIRKAAGA